jgi:ABC-type Co2+ transport system permease subunit
MNKALLQLTLSAFVAVVILSSALVLSHRFTVVAGANGTIMWKVDQVTGRTIFCYVSDGPSAVCEKVGR